MAVVEIPALDRRIHLFAVSDGAPGAPGHQTFLSQLENPEAVDTTLRQVFGHPGLDPSGAEVFAVSDIAAMGLRSYLADAYDIAPPVLTKVAARLDSLGGDVIVLTPKAVGAAAVTLTPPPHIRHIGSFDTIAPDTAPRPAPPVDLSPPLPRDQPRARVSGGSALVWLVLGLVVLVILALVL